MVSSAVCRYIVALNLRTGDPADATLIDGKWESIALASVGDPEFPHDFFLFTAVSVWHILLKSGGLIV